MSRPHTMDILAMLDKAGDEGLPAGALSRGFTEPVNITRRQATVNTVLGQLARSGKVRRSARKEASTYYHNTPAWRWFITPAGSEYLAQGGYAGKMAVARDLRQSRAAAAGAARREREQRRDAALARVQGSAVRCRHERNEQITLLRQLGVPLAEIGAMFGLSRERARQIASGIRCGRCRCYEHRREEARNIEEWLGWPVPERGSFRPENAGLAVPVPVSIGQVRLLLPRRETVSCAARALGVPGWVLRTWLAEGRLPHSLTAGGYFRVSAVELAGVITRGISERAGTVSRSSPGTGDEGGAGAPLARAADRAEPLPVPPDSRG